MIAVGVATFLTAGGSTDAGPSTQVLVLQRDVPAGATLEPADVRAVGRPVAESPADALADLPADRVALVGLAAGEVLLERRLAPGGIGPIAALLPPEASGVTLPAATLPAGVAVGDRGDLLVVVPGSTTALSDGAPIIGIDERSVTVAVPIASAPAIVEALTLGQLVAVLAPSW